MPLAGAGLLPDFLFLPISPSSSLVHATGPSAIVDDFFPFLSNSDRAAQMERGGYQNDFFGYISNMRIILFKSWLFID